MTRRAALDVACDSGVNRNKYLLIMIACLMYTEWSSRCCVGLTSYLHGTAHSAVSEVAGDVFAVSVSLGATPGGGVTPSEGAGVVDLPLEDEGELAGGGTGGGRGGGDGGSRTGVGVTVSPGPLDVVPIPVSGGGAPGLLEPPGHGAGGVGLAHKPEGEHTGGSGHSSTHSPAGAGGRGRGGGGGGADIDDYRRSSSRGGYSRCSCSRCSSSCCCGGGCGYRVADLVGETRRLFTDRGGAAGADVSLKDERSGQEPGGETDVTEHVVRQTEGILAGPADRPVCSGSTGRPCRAGAHGEGRGVEADGPRPS